MFEREMVASIFKELYGTEIDITNENHMIILQKIVYLMNAVGVPCGDFPFIWYLHGPYSYALDMTVRGITSDCIKTCSNMAFDDKTAKAIEIVRKLVTPPDGMKYEVDYYWPETLGSLHFLMKYMASEECEEEIIKKLIAAKPHLNNLELNKIAYTRIKEIMEEEINDAMLSVQE